MNTRSLKPDVRNPIMALPAYERLKAAPVEVRELLRDILMDARQDAHAKANESWKRRKGPMAAYWMAAGAYMGHIARACRHA